MSDLLDNTIAVALSLLESADKEDKDREALALELEQLNSKVAQISAKVTEMRTSVHEKRTIAQSQLTAAKTLKSPPSEAVAAAAPAEAPVVDLAKKRGAAAKGGAGKSKATTTAAAAPVKAAATKETKKGKAKGEKPAAAPAAPAKGVKKAKTKTAATAAPAADKPLDDKMPPLHERLRIVMGKDPVTIPDAIERLRARDPKWVPESTDLKAYISLALSTHVKDLFERVSRGVYRVREGAAAAPLKTVKKAAAAAPKANGAHANGASTEEVTDVMDNPFSTAAA